MKRLRKLKNNAGFSLAEMLMAVLILLMVSMIVATGMPAARNAYEKTVIGANAQAMLSTAVSALRDELGTAWDIKIDDDARKTTGTYITYFKADTGTKAMISIGADGVIALQDFVAVDFIHDTPTTGTYTEGTEHHLVPDKDTGLYATYTQVAYDSTTGVVTISGLKVCKLTGGAEIANLGKDDKNVPVNLKIRVLSKSAA